jgi:hypothetical protein
VTLESQSSSAAPRPANGDGTRLDSWKQIAAYLDRDIRTVQRWAQNKGLPVHRVTGGRGQSVFAFSGELDVWLRNPEADLKDDGAPASPRPRRVTAPVAVAVVGGLAVVAFVVFAFSTRTGAPRSVRVSGRNVVALDANGRTVWTRQDEQILTVPTSWMGEPDTPAGAAVVISGEVDSAAQSIGVLAGYSRTGTRLWRVTAQDTFRFTAGRYGPSWGTLPFLTYRVDGLTRIAWPVHHHTWWPSVLLVFDSSGRVVDRFVNAGWIMRIATSKDEKYLLATGVSQEFNGVMFAVLDARHPGGSSPTAGDSPFACLDCPAGRPLRYFVVPNPELAAYGDRNPLNPRINVFDSGAIELRVPAAPDALPGAEIIWEFSPTFDVETAGASGTYWDWHRRLEAQGLVTHRGEACQEQRGFTVREWTPQAGWRTIAVPARTTTARR